MFRYALTLTLIGMAVSAPQNYFKDTFKPTTLKGISYKIEGVVGGESQLRKSPDQVHTRVAPQDPVVVAGEYGGDLPSRPFKTTSTTTSTTTTTTPAPYRDDYVGQPAHYSFNAAVQDDINDHSHIRTETRDGLKTTGMYSYSDGFYQRTVHYVADENGYRVVKQDVKKIGDGPVFNSGGRADVSGSLIGAYSVVIGKEKDQLNYVDPYKLH